MSARRRSSKGRQRQQPTAYNPLVEANRSRLAQIAKKVSSASGRDRRAAKETARCPAEPIDSSSEDGIDKIACEACKKDSGDDNMLLCDGGGCDRGYHLYCLRPKLEGIPKGKWYCPVCSGDRSKARSKTPVPTIALSICVGPKCTRTHAHINAAPARPRVARTRFGACRGH
jgi:hypothetical protein